MNLYPFNLQKKLSATPKVPDVDSTTTDPFFKRPCASSLVLGHNQFGLSPSLLDFHSLA